MWPLRFAPLLALLACAPAPPPVTAETCRPANWQALGRAAGEAGEPRSAYEALAAACAPHGPPQPAAWGIGYDEGLARFCLPDRGYAFGLAGLAVRAECPAELAPAFNAAYVQGLREAPPRVAVVPAPYPYAYVYPYPYPYPYPVWGRPVHVWRPAPVPRPDPPARPGDPRWLRQDWDRRR